MFQAMYSSIGDEVAEIMFKVQPMAKDGNEPRSVFADLPQQMVHSEFSGLSRAAAQQQEGASPESAGPMPPLGLNPREDNNAQPAQPSGPKVGRNDPCPCGSGQKYKKCHGQ